MGTTSTTRLSRSTHWSASGRSTGGSSPLSFSQRFSGRLEDGGDTIRGRWDTSRDGSRWEHDFNLMYRRVG
jgi:hypothetical protein